MPELLAQQHSCIGITLVTVSSSFHLCTPRTLLRFCPQKEHVVYTRKCGPLAEMLDRVLQLELQTIRLQTNASQYSFV